MDKQKLFANASSQSLQGAVTDSFPELKYFLVFVNFIFLQYFNPLMSGGNKKVTHT